MKNLQNLKNASFALIVAIALAGCWGKKEKAQEITKSLNEEAGDKVKGNAETASTNMSSSGENTEAEQTNNEPLLGPDSAAPKPVNVAWSNEGRELGGGNTNVAMNYNMDNNASQYSKTKETPSKYSRSFKINDPMDW
jgi:hypothetical protein